MVLLFSLKSSFTSPKIAPLKTIPGIIIAPVKSASFKIGGYCIYEDPLNDAFLRLELLKLEFSNKALIIQLDKLA